MIVLLFGLLIMSIPLYILIKKFIFKIRGQRVQVKVTNSESIIVTIQGETKTTGHKTTFEFEYEGVYRNVTLKTVTQYEIGNTYNALYINNNSNKSLAVEGENYYSDENTTNIPELIFIIGGGLFAFLGLALMLEFDSEVIIGGCATFILLIFIMSSLMIHFLKNKNKKSNATIETGYATVYDLENNGIDETLTRYIPERINNNPIDSSSKITFNKKTRKKLKRNFVFIFSFVLCIGFGGMLSLAGVREVAETLNIKNTYPTTTATIISTYKYKSYSSEEDTPSYLVGVVYEYEVDGEKYTLDDKTGRGEDFEDYEVGNKVKLYYEEDNPSNAIAETEISVSFVPLAIGILFSIIGIFVLAEGIKRK